MQRGPVLEVNVRCWSLCSDRSEGKYEGVEHSQGCANKLEISGMKGVAGSKSQAHSKIHPICSLGGVGSIKGLVKSGVGVNKTTFVASATKIGCVSS